MNECVVCLTMTIEDIERKTIVWTMPRTASSALIKELVIKNNLNAIPKHWEPLTNAGIVPAICTPLGKILLDTIWANYSFKVMCYIQFTHDKHPDDVKHYGLHTLKEMMTDAKIAGYRNIFLFRKDARQQLRSFVFSVITNTWNPFSKLPEEEMIKKIHEVQDLDSVVKDCFKGLEAATINMDKLYNKAARLNIDRISVYETNDVIDYVPDLWAQGTNHLYHLVKNQEYEDMLQQRLERTCFYNDYFAD